MQDLFGFSVADCLSLWLVKTVQQGPGPDAARLSVVIFTVYGGSSLPILFAACIGRRILGLKGLILTVWICSKHLSRW